MKRTILTLTLALVALFASAQTERKDSIADGVSAPIEEAVPAMVMRCHWGMI